MTNSCLHCKLAEWERKPNGRFTGLGRCMWAGWIKWVLPKAFYYFITGVGNVQQVSEPYEIKLNRKAYFTNCPYFQPIKE